MPAKPPPIFEWHDLRAALGLLTRLPVKVNTARAMERGAAAAWAYPVVGLLVGGLAALVGLAALSVGASPELAAGLALATQVVVTGAMHEDGLADCADGFWGGWDRKRRLEIMKDSQIGAYGVLALIFVIGLNWFALTEILARSPVSGVLVLVAAAVLSRMAMLYAMAVMPHARPKGLAKGVGRPSIGTLWFGLGQSSVVLVVLALLLVAVGDLGALRAMGQVIVIASLPPWALMRLAHHKIGGQTGDVLGGVQAMTFCACLLATT